MSKKKNKQEFIFDVEQLKKCISEYVNVGIKDQYGEPITSIERACNYIAYDISNEYAPYHIKGATIKKYLYEKNNPSEKTARIFEDYFGVKFIIQSDIKESQPTLKACKNISLQDIFSAINTASKKTDGFFISFVYTLIASSLYLCISDLVYINFKIAILSVSFGMILIQAFYTMSPKKVCDLLFLGISSLLQIIVFFCSFIKI